jgi:hypothetical protein
MGATEAIQHCGPHHLDEEQVREVLGIPEHVRVICLLAIGHLRGEDGRYPGRLPASTTVFGECYGEPLNVASLAG